MSCIQCNEKEIKNVGGPEKHVQFLFDSHSPRQVGGLLFLSSTTTGFWGGGALASASALGYVIRLNITVQRRSQCDVRGI